jgi:hypothetical protein
MNDQRLGRKTTLFKDPILSCMNEFNVNTIGRVAYALELTVDDIWLSANLPFASIITKLNAKIEEKNSFPNFQLQD